VRQIHASISYNEEEGYVCERRGTAAVLEWIRAPTELA
jgi:hypothetical protein